MKVQLIIQINPCSFDLKKDILIYDSGKLKLAKIPKPGPKKRKQIEA